MLLRPFPNDTTSCASYLFGCTTHRKLAVVDPHADLVDDYLATAAALGAPVVAVFETHVQADYVSGLPALVARTDATAYLPADTGVEFAHVALTDGEVVELGNTLVTAIATPGHAPRPSRLHGRRPAARNRRSVALFQRRLAADRRRRPARPARRRRRAWSGGAVARQLKRLLELPDHVVLYPSHHAGWVCGRSLSGNPVSSIGFERAHNLLLAVTAADLRGRAGRREPPLPANQERIVAANRAGRVGAPA